DRLVSSLAAFPQSGRPARKKGGNRAAVAFLTGTALLCLAMTWCFLAVKWRLDPLRAAIAVGHAEATGRTQLETVLAFDPKPCARLPFFPLRRLPELTDSLRRRLGQTYRESLVTQVRAALELAEAAAGGPETGTRPEVAVMVVSALRRDLDDLLGRLPFPPTERDGWESDIQLMRDSLARAERGLRVTASGDAVTGPPTGQNRLAETGEDGQWAYPPVGGARSNQEAGRTLPTGSRGGTNAVRREALRWWRRQAAELWTAVAADIRDEELADRLRLAATGRDPAAELAREIGRHLLPLYADEESDPEIAWLRAYVAMGDPDGDQPPPTDRATDLRHHLAALLECYDRIAAKAAEPDQVLTLVRDSFRRVQAAESNMARSAVRASAADPFAEAERLAVEASRLLTAVSGGNGWPELSPLATYHYVRYLAVRLAAIHVQQRWRENVFYPFSPLTITGQGGDRSARKLVQDFLAETAGLWTMKGERVTRGEWDGIAFMFNAEFFEYCRRLAADDTGMSPSDHPPLTLTVDAVLVDADARERPVRTEFQWGGNREPQVFAFQNYRQSTTITWNGVNAGECAIRIHFPTCTLEYPFRGRQALANFVRWFGTGTATLTPDDFPGKEAALAALGISRISIRARLTNGTAFLARFESQEAVPPFSIITEANGGMPPARPAPGRWQPSAVITAAHNARPHRLTKRLSVPERIADPTALPTTVGGFRLDSTGTIP
ncbi:MAG: hypothetical protein LIP77_03855, partial [Planctomycetes bacterium]|nr:hypothetical protein [Planctomycetota bacterium]